MANELILSQYEYSLFLHRIRGHAEQISNRPIVKKEQTFQRDLVLCELHRQWGYDVPACDIDFLEYDRGNPVALVEYKKRNDWQSAVINKDSNLTALVRLGNRARIPVYCVFYSPDHSMFRVVPMNSHASARQQSMQFFEIQEEG
ncbi:hypothetical protein LCGC14_1326950 [marine sediment metagenome]|uniref:Uncharacterized protein n=1 Tax=marine sediment metagenome TaxID=412755 RepID=A0A0F9L3L8_9ZZZZ